MKKFEITFPLIWLILLLKPEFRAADYRAMLDKKRFSVFVRLRLEREWWWIEREY